MEWKGGKLERDIAYPLSWKLVNGKVYFNWWDFKGLFETKYDELIVLIGRVKEAGGWAWSEAPIEPLPGTIWGPRPSVVFAGGAGTQSGHLKVTAKMMKDFGWAISDAELTKLNTVLGNYKITDMRSIRLFMATCGHESAKGRDKLETGSDAYFASRGYTRKTRGAGYIQLTGVKGPNNPNEKTNQQLFLDHMGVAYPSDGDYANLIASKYPWEAAGWFWSISPNSGEGNLNNYVIKYGSGENIFLLTQLWVNSWPRYADGRKDANGDYMRMPNDTAVLIRDSKIQWSIANGILKVGNDEFLAPIGWSTPVTGRKDCYDNAIKSFK